MVSMTAQGGPACLNNISRWIATYSLLIRPDSRVRLTTERMRAEDSQEPIFGFGIRARVDLQADEWLFELAGLVPSNA